MITEPLQWICAVLGALMVGISKSGITGLSILSVALFTHVFPSSKQASGLVLPLLIFGDFVAVLSYRTTPSGAIYGSSYRGRPPASCLGMSRSAIFLIGPRGS